MSGFNVRVESRHLHPNASKEQQERAFRSMLSVFKKKVNDFGVLNEYNQKQFFETRGQKIRRKRKESEIRNKKENEVQRDNFGQV